LSAVARREACCTRWRSDEFCDSSARNSAILASSAARWVWIVRLPRRTMPDKSANAAAVAPATTSQLCHRATFSVDSKPSATS
jgi:hypothetical protein